MDHHLAGEEPGNRRNGYGKKTVVTDTGQIELEVPRDRQARFDPQLVAKYKRRFPGFDEKIVATRNPDREPTGASDHLPVAKGRKSKNVRRIGNGSVEPYSGIPFSDVGESATCL